MNSYHIVLNNARNNSRVLKLTGSLIKYNFVDKIYIIGIWENGLLEEEWIDDRRCIIRVKLPLQVLQSKGKLKRRSILRKTTAACNIYI